MQSPDIAIFFEVSSCAVMNIINEQMPRGTKSFVFKDQRYQNYWVNENDNSKIFEDKALSERNTMETKALSSKNGKHPHMHIGMIVKPDIGMKVMVGDNNVAHLMIHDDYLFTPIHLNKRGHGIKGNNNNSPRWAGVDQDWYDWEAIFESNWGAPDFIFGDFNLREPRMLCCNLFLYICNIRRRSIAC